MNTLRKIVLIGLVFLSLPLCAVADEVASPDGRIVVSVGVDAGGSPQYSVRYRGEPIFPESRLGLRFLDQPAFESAFDLVASERRSGDTTWEQPWGERRLVRDRYNELLVTFRGSKDSPRTFSLRVRVHDDGFGFRYEVPEQPGYAEVAIVDEITEFRVSLDATAWWIPGRQFNRYEYIYRETPVAEVSLAHTPITFRYPDGVHVSLHEAALVDYAAYTIDQRRPGVLQTNLAPRSDGVRVRLETPFRTPWRTVQISPDAVGLLNSSLILNLNEPNALGDVSWVEPGKYVGIWWGMHLAQKTWGSGPNHGATTAETMRQMDFAAQHGFDGVLVEGWNVGWDGDWYDNGALFSFTQPYPDFDIEAITAYGRDRGVRLIGHNETSGHISNYENQMADAFALYEKLGIRQVKTGYVADAGQLQRVGDDGVLHYEWHESQHAVDHYLRVVQEAAKHKVSINTHEPVKDTGLRRTYPNWISREGARGQEFNAWGDPPNPPSHTAILPYTRMLAGPMDFTPGIFDLTFNGPGTYPRVSTTLTKQLALYVVLYSPIQMAADLLENYAAHPDAFRFIEDVPTDWEESIAVAGEVGDFVVFARRERGGDDWYVGALTNEDARTVPLPLDFLDAGRDYVATVYRDGDDAHWDTDPYEYVIENLDVDAGDTLQLKLAAGGGTAIRLTPK